MIGLVVAAGAAAHIAIQCDRLAPSAHDVFVSLFAEQMVWGTLNDRFHVALQTASGERLDFEAFGSVYFRADGSLGHVELAKIDEDEVFAFRPSVNGTTNVGVLDYRSGVKPELTSASGERFACRPTHAISGKTPR